MFDIGFSELMVVGVISLVVMGPERLPETLRGINLWVGRIKASLSSAKKEIEDELGMDQVREQLHNEKILRDLENTKQETEKLMTEAKTPFKES
ncbi:MAG: twin-arginine translocase subunit TatB [Cellvibrionales bacterium TMED148]|nr:twin-arginine translocase subunit TatB [Porticoccaceae bacterium]RPG89330.1 MAG: twin-arginine translocase subunit TatB [Cellvibrionales bacterium TMED148]|tara:strand:- start:235 stop:516 length:282 start_codon:yes stop_codon:yes gene_type:complete